MFVFVRGLFGSLSIMLGYFPAAVTFGLLSTVMGFSALETILVSALIFAGSSQFALITLFGESLVSAIFIPLFMNLRHIIYSCITSQRVKLEKPYLTAFGLTDEVFATSLNGPPSEEYIWGLELGGYTAWVLGTVLGALGGKVIMTSQLLSKSLLFSLTLLFFILLISRLNLKQLFCAIISGLLCWPFIQWRNFSLGLILSSLVVPMIMVFFDKEEKM